MHLSRLELDVRHRRAREDAADPYRLHQTLMRAFDHTSPEERRVLFRLELQRGLKAVVLVQSNLAPRWEAAEEWWGEAFSFATKPWEPAFQANQMLRFRLRANPTVKRNGKRHALYREEDQLAWLQRKLEAAGAHPQSVDPAPEGNVSAQKLLSSPSEQHPREKQRLTLFSVLFNGRLTVADPEPFAEALARGIGPAKGLGFGLLSVAPVR